MKAVDGKGLKGSAFMTYKGKFLGLKQRGIKQRKIGNVNLAITLTKVLTYVKAYDSISLLMNKCIDKCQKTPNLK